MPHILVLGAGPAGSTCAYWLARGGATVTVCEHSATPAKLGQGIDVEGTARVNVRRMGVEDTLRARGTGEAGFTMVDDEGLEVASVGGLLTQEIEILRGEVAEVLCEAARETGKVEYRYGVTLKEIRQGEKNVSVTFNDGSEAEFDALVGADGLRSRTRSLIMPDAADCFRAKDLYVAFFSIPRETEDAQHARWQSAPGGKGIFVRPANVKISSAYLTFCANLPTLAAAVAQPRPIQKAAIKNLFASIGGLAPRVVAGMMETQDFYFERLAQIKLPHWSRGRCGLIGDAAAAPSPLTGEGTNVALVTAYICAGEMTANPNDPAAAFATYEAKSRAFAEKAQNIPLGGYAPNLAIPQTAWGIWVLRTVFWVIARSGLWKLFPGKAEERFALPEYPQFEREGK